MMYESTPTLVSSNLLSSWDPHALVYVPDLPLLALAEYKLPTRVGTSHNGVAGPHVPCQKASYVGA
jgi:hypothetical protein